MNIIEAINAQTHLLSVKELSDLIRCHKETLRRWIRNERFAAFRVGRCFKADPNQVAEWLKERGV